MSRARDPFVLWCITVPSVARIFGIPLERQDLLVCSYVNHRDLQNIIVCETYVSPSRSTPLLRLIEGMCSNLLREPLVPAGLRFGVRF
jgi:hypothetical protein